MILDTKSLPRLENSRYKNASLYFEFRDETANFLTAGRLATREGRTQTTLM